MQNRYVGDVGDFGKLGMLRYIERAGIKVGINWYLTEDENHNKDGKHIGYMHDKKFEGIDDDLRNAFSSLVNGNNRSVLLLKNMKLLQADIYYHEIIKTMKGNVRGARSFWHQQGLESIKGSELIFLDPDNGLIPKSVSYGSVKSKKYVLPEEIIDYYQNGCSVVFYNHRTREQLDDYLKRFTTLFQSKKLEEATIVGITYRRGTVRDYFMILQEEHKDRVLSAVEDLLNSKWRLHFEKMELE